MPTPPRSRSAALALLAGIVTGAAGLAGCRREAPPPPAATRPPEPEAPVGFGQGGGPEAPGVTASELRAAVALVNRGLPTPVDEVTRLDSIVLDGQRVVYRYTTALDRRLDPAQRAVMDSALAVLARRACNTVLARRAFDAGFDLRYEYARLNGAPETAVDITRASCLAAERAAP